MTAFYHFPHSVRTHRTSLLRSAIAGLTLCMINACSELPVGAQDSATIPATANRTAISLSLPVSVPTPTQTQSLPMLSDSEYAVVLDETHWLSASPSHSLSLITQQPDSKTQHQILHAGAVEYLDVRQTTAGTHALTLNQNNALVLATLPQNSEHSLASSQPLAWAIEGLCLYQPAQEPLQAFLLDDTAMAHQVLLTRDGAALAATVIRSFPLPPGSEYCTVDDPTETLFVSEEGIGVWAYNARSESDITRTPVELVAPWGKLQQNAGPLAMANGSLLIGEKDHHLLHQYQVIPSAEGIQTLHSTTYHLEGVVIDGLHASDQSSQKPVRAMVLNDDSGELEQLSLSIPARTATTDVIPTLPASAETDAVATPGDAADDPAIWVHPTRPAASQILGTNKKQGLYRYDLSGNTRQFLPIGRVNNVDVRQGFTLKGQPADIAAASQRDRHSISLIHIDPHTGKLRADVEIPTSLSDVYGLCMYQNTHQQVFVFINDKDGRYEQYQILDSDQGWRGKHVRSFKVPTQPEGCAADDRNQRLFVGEENHGIWIIGAEPDAGQQLTAIAELGQPSGRHLVADIEGLDLYQTEEENLLVVSSQGNDSYVIFSADAPYPYLGRFRIGLNHHASSDVDGASETDGLTVSSANLGPQYPKGLLVVQDGRNLMPNANQNFKLLDWQVVRQRILTQP